jgi:GTP-binding protein HflX
LLQEVVNEELKVFLVDIVPKQFPQEILDDRMRELENLVDTYGGSVVMQKYQRKDTPDLKTYLGKGKLEEIIEDMKSKNLNLLIIGNILKPRQLYEISEKLRPFKIRVWDRVDLILKIFGIHAEGMEARLQIELASIKHMGPRIFGMGLELSKQGAGQ